MITRITVIHCSILPLGLTVFVWNNYPVQATELQSLVDLDSLFRSLV